MAVGAFGFGVTESAFALQTVQDDTFGPGLQTATVSCPAGRHVVSGGGYANGPGYLYATRKDGNGWTASGDPLASGGSYDVTAYAYCARHNFHLLSFRDTNSSGGTLADASPSCGHGTHFISGGAYVKSPTGLLYSLVKVGNGWDAADDTVAQGGTAAIIGWAYCSPQRYSLVKTRKSGAEGAGDNIKAPCPAGTTLVSGGGSSDGMGDIYGSRKAGNGWRISAAITTPGSTRVKAIAYCR